MTCLTFSRREFVIGALAGTTAGAGITAALLRKSSSVPSGSSGGSVSYGPGGPHHHIELYCG